VEAACSSPSHDTVAATIQKAEIRAKLNATIQPGSLFSNLNISLNANIKIPIPGAGSVLSIIRLHAIGNDLPLAHVRWTGSLQGRRQDILLTDQNLFDRAPPKVFFTKRSCQGVADPGVILPFVTELNYRFGPFDPIPTSSNGSIRGAWLSPPKQAKAVCGSLQSGGESLLLFQNVVTCEGASCPSLISRSLAKLVVDGCENPTPITSSLTSQLSYDVQVSKTHVTVSALTASTKASINCANANGTLRILLETGATKPTTIPVDLFDNSIEAFAGVTKSIPLNSAGSISGSITKNGEILSALSGDIFSESKAGALVPDKLLNAQTKNNLILAFRSACSYKTEVPLIDNPINDWFHDISPSLVAYENQSPLPTVVGFLEYFANLNQFQLFADSSSVSLRITRTGLQSASLSPPSSAVQATNGQLILLWQALRRGGPPTVGAITASTTAAAFSFAINLHGILDNSAPSASFEQPTQWQAVTSFQAHLNTPLGSVKSTYDHGSKAVSFYMFDSLSLTSITLAQGRVVRDGPWHPSPFLPGSLVQAVDQLRKSALLSTIASVGINPRPFGGSSLEWADTLSRAQSIMMTQGHSAFAVRDQLQQYYLSLGELVFVSPVFDPATPGSLFLQVKLHSMKTMKLDGNWRTVTALNRLNLPLLLSTTVTVVLTTSTPSVSIGLSANTVAKSWLAPIQYGMQSGTARGSVTVQLAIPDTPSSLHISMKAPSGLGAEIKGDIIVSNIHSDAQMEIVNFNVSEKETNPAQYLGALTSVLYGFMNRTLEGPLGSAFPGLTNKLAHGLDFNQISRLFQAWSTTPASPASIILMSNPIIPSKIPRRVDVSVVIDGFLAVICPTDINPSTVDTITQSLNQGMVKCSIADYLVFKTETAHQNQQIGLYPAIPGIISRIALSFSTPAEDFFDSLNTTLPITPAFGGWNDCAAFLEKVLMMEIEPKLVSVPFSDFPVAPRYLSKYGNLTSLQLSIQHNVSGSVSNSLAPAINALDGNVQLQTAGAYLIRSNLQTSMFFNLLAVWDGPPTSKMMYASTNFSATDQIGYLVPNDPNNSSFQLSFVLENRASPENVSLMEFSGLIHLQPGQPFKTEIPFRIMNSVTNPLFKKVLNISMTNVTQYNENGTKYYVPQIQIQLDVVELDTGELLVPLSLSIQSFVWCFDDIMLIPSKSRIAVTDFSASLQLAGSVDRGAVQGSLSVLGVSSSEVSGSIAASVLISQKEFFSVNNLSASAYTSEALMKLVDIDTSLQHDVQVKNPQLSPPVDAAGVQLGLDQILKITNVSELDSFFRNAPWGAKAMNSPTLDKILKVPAKTTFCQHIRNFATVSNNMSTNSALNAKLPFVSTKFIDIFKGLLDKLDDLIESVCEADEKMVVDQFCKVLGKFFSDDKVCAVSKIDNSSLKVTINISIPRVLKSAQFEFETKKFLPNSPLSNKLPEGSANAALMIKDTIDVELTLITDFSSEVPKLSFQPGSKFGLQVSLDLNDAVKANFGPVSLFFGSLNVSVGKPASFTATITDDSLDFDVNGEASMIGSLQIQKLQVNCNLNAKVDLPKFLHGRPNSFTFTQNCGDKSFYDVLIELLDSTSLLDFFEDPGRFTFPWMNGIGRFLGRIPNWFGRALPWIEKHFFNSASSDIRSPAGPGFINELYSKISKMVTDLHLKQKIENVTEAFILKEFTKILCDVTKMDPCPEVPKNCTKSCSWLIVLQKETTKLLTQLLWQLGKTFAQFDVNCTLALKTSSVFQFRLTLDRMEGIKFSFPKSPVFDTSGSVGVTRENCHLFGKLGFLGAAFHATGNLTARFSIANNTNTPPTFRLSADLTGQAIVGWAGFTSDLARGEAALLKGPQARWDITFTWGMAFPHSMGTQPWNFSVSNSQLCLGTTIGDFLKPYTQQIDDKILKPLSPLVGKDGLLTKTIPGTSLLTRGGDMNVAQFLQLVYHIYCDDCEFDGVFELIEFASIITRDLETLNQMINTNCVAWSKIEDFWANFTQSDYPHIGPPVDRTPQIPDNWPQLKAATFEMVHQFETKGKWGLHFDFFDQPTKYLIQIMLEGDQAQIPVFSITVPQLIISIGATWTIPVWSPPYVAIEVSFQAGAVANIGRVVFLLDGLAKAVTTGSPGQLLNALALPVHDLQGNVIRQFTAFIRITGGVYVSIGIVDGRAYVFIEIDAFASVHPVNEGDEYTTFDNIITQLSHSGGLGKIFDMGASISVGIGIKLRACFWGCWTIIHKEWKWTWNLGVHRAESIKPLADQYGVPDLDRMRSDDLSLAAGPNILQLAEIGNSLVYLRAPADASSQLSRSNLKTVWTGPVQLVRNPPQGVAWTLQVLGLTTPIIFSAATQYNTISISQFSYKDPGVWDVDQTQVLLNGAYGVINLPRCLVINLYEAVFGNLFSFIGNPCPVTIESLFSNITCSGVAASYANKPITVTGPSETIHVLLQQTNYLITQNQVSTDGGFQIQFQDLVKLNVDGHQSQNTQFEIQTIPFGMLEVTGGTGDDYFYIPNFNALQRGSIHMIGGAGVNKMNLTLSTTFGPNVTIGPSFVLQRKADDELSGIVRFVSIQTQHVYVYGAPGISQINVRSPEPGVDLYVHQIAKPGETIWSPIVGCQAESTLWIKPSGGGYHLIEIGTDKEPISTFQCVVRVYASLDPGQVVDIKITALADPKNLQWQWENNQLLVIDALNGMHQFQLIWENVQRIRVQYGIGGSNVLFSHGSDPTEHLHIFPTNTTNLNQMTISGTQNANLITGNLSQIIIGTVSNNVDPMAALIGTVAISSNITQIPVFMDGSGPLAPAQTFLMDSICLNSKKDKNGPIRKITKPTQWFCDLLAQYNIPNRACQDCAIGFDGKLFFNIKTSIQADWFDGINVTVPLNLSLGAGDNRVFYGPTAKDGLDPTNVIFETDVDVATFYLPMNGVNISLGNDRRPDSVNVCYENDDMPNQNGNVLYPVGNNPQDRLTLYQKYVEDSIFVRQDSRTNFQPTQMNFQAAQPTQGPIILNLSDFEGPYYAKPPTGSTIILVDAAAGIEIHIDGEKNSTTPATSDWTFIIRLLTIQADVKIHAWADPNNNATVLYELPLAPINTYLLLVEDRSGDGFITEKYAMTELHTRGISHVKLQSKILANITMASNPSASDMVIETVPGSFVWIQNPINNIIVVNATTFIPSGAVQANNSIVSIGRAAVTYIDCSFVNYTTFTDGCLETIPVRQTKVVSNWFTTHMASYGLYASLTGCSSFSFEQKLLDLICNATNITGLGINTTFNMIAEKSKSINILDPVDWNRANYTNKTLQVDNLYCFQLVDPYPSHQFELLSYSSPTSNTTRYFDGDNTYSAMVTLSLVGGEEQHLRLGAIQNLTSPNTSILITSQNVGLSRVSVESSYLEMPLDWFFNSSSFSLTVNQTNCLNVTYIGVNILNMSFGLNSNITFLSGPEITETMASFPSNGSSRLNLFSGSNTFFITGGLQNLSIGNSTVDPSVVIRGIIAVIGSGDQPINFLYHPENAHTSMSFGMNQNCLNRTDAPNPKPMGSRICGFAREFKIPCDFCTVSYSKLINFDLSLGNQDDRFFGRDIEANVSIKFGRGNDICDFAQITANVIANFSLDEGMDRIHLQEPVCSMSLDVGDDLDPDVIVIKSKLTPNIFKNSFGPLDQHMVQTKNINPLDSIQEYRVLSNGSSTLYSMKIIEVPAGVSIQYEITNRTSYNLISMGDKSAVSFIATGSIPIEEWEVIVNFEDYQTSSLINVVGQFNTTGTVMLNVKGNLSKQLVWSDSFGLVNVQNVALRITNISHFGVSSLSPVEFTSKGLPRGTEFVFDAPSDSLLTLESLDSFALIRGPVVTLSESTDMTSTIVIVSSPKVFFSTPTNSIFHSNGCFDTGRSITRYPSDWMKIKLSALGADFLPCPLQWTTQILDIEAPKLLIERNSSNTVNSIILASPLVTIIDTEEWNHLMIAENITVDSRYSIQWRIQSNILFSEPKITPSTHLQLNCNDPLLSRVVIGNPSRYPLYTAQGTCDTVITSDLFKVGVEGSRSTYLTVSPGSYQVAELVFSDDQVMMYLGSQSISSHIIDLKVKNSEIRTSFIFQKGENFIQFERNFSIWPAFHFESPEKSTIKSEIYFPIVLNGSLITDTSTFSFILEQTKTNQITCLNENSGTDVWWTALATKSIMRCPAPNPASCDPQSISKSINISTTPNSTIEFLNQYPGKNITLTINGPLNHYEVSPKASLGVFSVLIIFVINWALIAPHLDPFPSLPWIWICLLALFAIRNELVGPINHGFETGASGDYLALFAVFRYLLIDWMNLCVPGLNWAAYLYFVLTAVFAFFSHVDSKNRLITLFLNRCTVKNPDNLIRKMSNMSLRVYMLFTYFLVPTTMTYLHDMHPIEIVCTVISYLIGCYLIFIRFHHLSTESEQNLSISSACCSVRDFNGLLSYLIICILFAVERFIPFVALFVVAMVCILLLSPISYLVVFYRLTENVKLNIACWGHWDKVLRGIGMLSIVLNHVGLVLMVWGLYHFENGSNSLFIGISLFIFTFHYSILLVGYLFWWKFKNQPVRIDDDDDEAAALIQERELGDDGEATVSIQPLDESKSRIDVGLSSGDD